MGFLALQLNTVTAHSLVIAGCSIVGIISLVESCFVFFLTNAFMLLRSHVLEGCVGDFVGEMLGILNSNVDTSGTCL